MVSSSFARAAHGICLGGPEHLRGNDELLIAMAQEIGRSPNENFSAAVDHIQSSMSLY
jgi:hypothetical protein